jgi:hypothetical protein
MGAASVYHARISHARLYYGLYHPFIANGARSGAWPLRSGSRRNAKARLGPQPVIPNPRSDRQLSPRADKCLSQPVSHLPQTAAIALALLSWLRGAANALGGAGVDSAGR